MEIPVLRIKSDDQQLYWEALRTYPVAPAYAEIIFIADGVRPLQWGKWKNKKEYVEACHRRRIIPNSIYTIEDSLGDYFVQSPRYNLGRIQDLIGDGRVNTVRIELSSFNAFKKFPNVVFQSLEKNKYHILNVYFSGERDPTSRGVRTNFGRGDFRLKESGLELVLDSGDSGLGPTHERWFKRLEKKYG